MAITTDDAIDKFGTQTEITNSPSAVADGAFSVAGDVSAWTNSDDAPTAMFRLLLTAAGLGGAPTTGSVINLFAEPQNIDGSTGDQYEPSADFPHTYLGSFPIMDLDADQQILIGPVRLPNYKTSSEYLFFIENQMGQSQFPG